VRASKITRPEIVTVFAAAGSPVETGAGERVAGWVGDDEVAADGAGAGAAVGDGDGATVVGAAAPVTAGAGVAVEEGDDGTAAVAGTAVRTPATRTAETPRPTAAPARASPEKNDMDILLIRGRRIPAPSSR
jgi:hypothetical protein